MMTYNACATQFLCALSSHSTHQAKQVVDYFRQRLPLITSREKHKEEHRDNIAHTDLLQEKADGLHIWIGKVFQCDPSQRS